MALPFAAKTPARSTHYRKRYDVQAKAMGAARRFADIFNSNCAVAEIPSSDTGGQINKVFSM